MSYKYKYKKNNYKIDDLDENSRIIALNKADGWLGKANRDSCIYWLGPLDKYGKPTIVVGATPGLGEAGRYVQPHRILYERHFKVRLKKSDWVYRTKDHCRIHLCMNPEHMHVSSMHKDGNRVQHGAVKVIMKNGLLTHVLLTQGSQAHLPG